MEAAIAVGSAVLPDVIDWGWNALQSLWAEAPKIAEQVIVQAGADTLTDLVTSGIGSVVNWVSGGIEDIAWIPDWVKYSLNTFAGNIGEALGNIATGMINMARTGSLEILGVTNAQENYMNNLQSSLDIQLNAMLERIQMGQSEDVRITEQAAAEFTNSLERTVTNAYRDATAFLQSSQIGISGQMEGAVSWAKNTLAASLLAIQYQGRVATDMISKDMAGVSTYLTEFAVKEPERFLQSIENTIVIPAANAEAMQWALSNIDTPTDEEMLETLKHLAFVYNELAVDMAAKQAIVPEFTVRKRTE